MAATGKRPQASGRKGAPAKGGKRRTAPAGRKPSRRKQPAASTVATGLVVLALGAFLLYALLGNSNAPVLVYARGLVNLLCGQLGWLSVLLVCWLGLQWTFERRWPLPSEALLLAAALALCLMTVLQVFETQSVLREVADTGDDGYFKFVEMSGMRSKDVVRGGGSLGALLAYPLDVGLGLGVPGSVLALFFAIGACGIGLVRRLFPSAGDSFGGFLDTLRDRLASRRDARATEREAALRYKQEALLVPLPEELLRQPPDPEEAEKPKVARGRKLAAGQAGAKLPPKGVGARAAKTPPPQAEPSAPRRKLYIVDEMPGERVPPSEEAYTEYDVEHAKYDTRPRRRSGEPAPAFLTKRQEAGDVPEAGPEAAPPQADDLPPWEADAPAPVEAMPAAPAETPAPRRGDPYLNPLDKTPEIPREERLDRPDWKPPKEAAVEAAPPMDEAEYRRPPLTLLAPGNVSGLSDTRDEDGQNSRKLEEALASFGVEARVIKVVHGPSITRYELQPAMGVKVSKIVNLTDDIALTMAAMSVRIEAPIPGKAAIGIEIANQERQIVYLRDVLEGEESRQNASKLAVALGKDITGRRIIADLAQMPHLLIAGQTGAGKSMCINSLLTSLIYRATPEEVRLILVDPKKVELPHYNGIPHLLVPVVTDAKKASGALHWAVMEMDERYKLFADVGVNHISKYNAVRPEGAPQMPQIVIVIDELADLMLVAPGEVEDSIIRIAQLARACGIYLVIATQRPSANVITGLIKANVPSRIAFRVASQIDSRIILDANGAEKLLGKGDMLFAQTGANRMVRVQGCFVADIEVKKVTDFIKERYQAEYSQQVIEALDTQQEEGGGADEDFNEASGDALFQQAVEMAIEAGQISISMLQRRLRVGYARAGRLIDEMARRNLIGQAEGSKPREVLVTPEDARLLFKK